MIEQTRQTLQNIIKAVDLLEEADDNEDLKSYEIAMQMLIAVRNDAKICLSEES